MRDEIRLALDEASGCLREVARTEHNARVRNAIEAILHAVNQIYGKLTEHEDVITRSRLRCEEES